MAEELDFSKLDSKTRIALTRRGRSSDSGLSEGSVATGMGLGMSGTISSAAEQAAASNLVPVANPQVMRGMKLDRRSMGGQTFEDLKEDITKKKGEGPPEERRKREPGEGASPDGPYDYTAGDYATRPGESGYSRSSADDADITAAERAQTNASDWQKYMGSNFVKGAAPYLGMTQGAIAGAGSAVVSGNWFSDMIHGVGKGVFDTGPAGLVRRGINMVNTAYQGEQVTDAMTDVYGPNFDPNKATPEQLEQMKTGFQQPHNMFKDLATDIFTDKMTSQDKVRQEVEETLGTSEDFVDPSGDPSSQPKGYSGPTKADNEAAALEADTQKLGELKSQYDSMSSKAKEQQGGSLERQIKDLESKLGMSTGNAATSTTQQGGKDYSKETTFGASGSTDFNQAGSAYDPDRTDNYGGASGGGGYSQSG